MIRARIAIAILIALPALLAPLAARSDPTPSGVAGLHVIYLAGGSVYVDAGASEGLGEGDTLLVTRGGAAVARLRVGVLSSHRASCDTLVTFSDVRLGDSVRLLAAAPRTGTPIPAETPIPAATTVRDSTAAARATPARHGRPWMRGRVGARWLSVSGAGNTHLQQPMMDLRLDGGGETAPLSAGLDLRGRRTTRVAGASSAASEAEARVYRASLTFRPPGGPGTLTVGRTASPSLASVSLFDGALLESGNARWRVGAFGGTQPEPVRMGWSGDIAEYGAYAELRKPPIAERRWSVGLGGVSSYFRGSRNRDFVFGQAFWHDRRLSGTLLQEADVLRGWRRGPNDPGFSLTSTFASAQAQVTPWVQLQSGYDNRRSVRLWRDRLTPESEFDDRYREGAWAGASVRTPSGFGVSGDQRWNRTAGQPATVTDASAEYFRPRLRALMVRGRWSEYRADADRSRLYSASLGGEPVPGTHLELSGGKRDTATGGISTASTRWWSAEMDLSLARRWFMDASFESDRDDFGRSSQFYAGVSRRL